MTTPSWENKQGAEVNEQIIDYVGYFASGRTIRADSTLQTLSRSWDIVPHDPERYTSHVEGWHHERIMIMHCYGDGVILTRREHQLGDAVDRFVQMSFMKSGTVTSTQGTAEVTATAGSVIALVLDHPFESVTGDVLDLIICYIPQSHFESRGINTDLMAGVVMQDVAMVPVVQDIVAWALELQRKGDDSQKRFIERSLLEIFTAMAERFVEGFAVMDDASVVLRRHVLEMIESEFTDPLFSAVLVARKLGLSTRQLYRLFEGRDASLARLIRDRRVDHAQDLLRHHPEVAIAQVAVASGFLGSDQLTKAFRRRYGVSPSEYRDTLKVDDTTETAR